MLSNGSPLVTFNIREAYQIALPLVRRALNQFGLLVPAEMDVALRIRRELGAVVAPCTVLFVDDPALLLEGIVYHRAAALGIPQAVVVSGRDRHTEVLIRSLKSQVGGLPGSVQNPLIQLQEQIVLAIETVAEPEDAGLVVDRLR
jgi:hypothetical protein